MKTCELAVPRDGFGENLGERRVYYLVKRQSKKNNDLVKKEFPSLGGDRNRRYATAMLPKIPLLRRGGGGAAGVVLQACAENPTDHPVSRDATATPPKEGNYKALPPP